MTFGVSNLPGANGAFPGSGLTGNGAMAAQNFLNALLGQDDAPKSSGQQFLSDVKDTKNPHEKQALIDGFAEGFAAASQGNQGAQGGNGAQGGQGAHHGHRAHHHHHDTQGGQGARGGNGADGAGSAQGVGGAQGADGQNGDAGSPLDLMQGFKEIADKVADSLLPRGAKNALLDGIAEMMSKLQGQSGNQAGAADDAGAPADGANGGQGSCNGAVGADSPQAPQTFAPQSTDGTDSTDGSDQNGGTWTHEVKDGQATIRLGDKYTIKADEKGAEWTVTNNETGKTMKVSGDPHVDINNDGKNDFDFSKPMSFKLDDGTNITVNTVKGDGDGKPYSSGLTITNGDNAIQVTGLGDKFDGQDNLAVTQSNEGRVVDNLTNDGSNTIYENGGAWTTGGGNPVDNAYIERAEAMYG